MTVSWTPKLLLAALACLALLASPACSERRNSADVSGKISVRGKPMEDIGVAFEPLGSGAGRGSFGKTDAEGNYTLHFVDNDQPGALVGKHLVTFADLQNVGTSDEPDAGPMMPIKKSRLPAKHLSEGQEFEVKPGENQADFDLK